MARLEELRRMPCAVWDDQTLPHGTDYRPGDYDCQGLIQAHHHTGHRGIGQKSDDEKSFPLCIRHHGDFHSARGMFRSMDKEQRRAWQDMMVERYDRILCDPEAF